LALPYNGYGLDNSNLLQVVMGHKGEKGKNNNPGKKDMAARTQKPDEPFKNGRSIPYCRKG
jgi:hypothetical protein